MQRRGAITLAFVRIRSLVEQRSDRPRIAARSGLDQWRVDSRSRTRGQTDPSQR
jgi:hypothetical protein